MSFRLSKTKFKALNDVLIQVLPLAIWSRADILGLVNISNKVFLKRNEHSVTYENNTHTKSWKFVVHVLNYQQLNAQVIFI